ncbi:hypothetical protein GH714_022821 [Hevea brasiliensis]|uniref:Neprosin PEP catalytic domain-containing protein n=1 Tax=Hevea brasiliensis TaxID=3981 RepID=A0A6A6M3N2_HEVBR|nr:hypothetical protein GH714_022821 [Hevea brasiliensis]
MVDWGGEVVNSRANGHHTSNHMASGHFAEDGFGKASYFRNLEIVDSDNRPSLAQAISILAESTNCYKIQSSMGPWEQSAVLMITSISSPLSLYYYYIIIIIIIYYYFKNDCHAKCWKNCTCVAYKSASSDGIGCQFLELRIKVLVKITWTLFTFLLMRKVKEVLGRAAEVKPGKVAYLAPYLNTEILYVYSSLTGFRPTLSPPPDYPDQRAIVEVIGHKAQGAVPEPGYVVIARVTKVMAKMASADIMCLGPKSVQQDVRATEIGKVDMHLSFHPGDIVRALVLSLGDARAYHLSTAKNELGVVSAESTAGATMVPISWTGMKCSLTGQIERRKIAKVGS